VLLQDVLYKIKIQSVRGNTGIDVSDICIDSRKLKHGTVFIAIKGTASDGHQFIDIVIQNGAHAIICENLPEKFSENITYIQVENSAAAAGLAAHNVYGNPSQKLKLVGITGTNGKTTIATLLFKLFSSFGYKCGLISTVRNLIGDEELDATHTTPDAVSLNFLLAQMASKKCEYVFMEVSSHAIHQHRIEGLQFAGGIFSNITRDHLDYHKTFDEYIRVKKMFFDALPKTAFALTNIDDKHGMVMMQNTAANVKTYSLKNASDFKGKILDNSITGLHMLIDEQDIYFRLIGEFNAYNLLATYAAAVCFQFAKNDVLQSLSGLQGAEGRFDYMISPQEKIIAIVDYAHTPDALLNVLAAIKKLRKGFEQIITVTGCGGDRDKGKRSLMAEIACAHSNKIIFTSDNPRSENPTEIIKEMEAGVPAGSRRKCISIVDRKEAIKTAIMLAGVEDIVLIAGKGHENYQEINGIKNHFDDKETVKEIFELLNK
jgi:UDP-N-acetylmuramoyl-L-alanyl-D-glutamate--2,6-diaminopimelate ligase